MTANKFAAQMMQAAIQAQTTGMKVELDAKDKILDQHIAALRSVAWAITDKARGGFDDIVAEAKRVRAELETRDAQFTAMLASYSDECSALALDIANKTAELEACRRDAEKEKSRLNFLLQFLSIEDVGDDCAAWGVVVHTNSMEEALGGTDDPENSMRSIIDEAISAWEDSTND